MTVAFTAAATAPVHAQGLIEQHGMMAEILAGLPEASTRTPGAMNNSHTDRLLALRGQEDMDMLNRHDVDQQVEAHEQALRAYETFAENGEVPALKAYAQRFLPATREHLQAARALQLPRAE
jgi:predicted outer membrane protein